MLSSWLERCYGEIVWQLDTTARFDTILGEQTQGGSFGGAAGPVALNGMLLLSSGYGIYNHMAGNLLLALTIQPRAAEQ